jgi:hypothetical protein
MEGPKKRWFSGSSVGGKGNGTGRSLLEMVGAGLPRTAAGGFERAEEAASGEAAGDGSAGGEAGGEDAAFAEQAAPERTVLSRKELARELRRQAYRRAKQARAEDPRHLAMKEAAKLRRREQYQQVKVRRKEREAEQKAKDKVSAAATQAEAKRQLAERVKSALGRGSEPARALARDIERALQCTDVRELMDRLRSESAALAAQHQDDGKDP